MRKNVLYYSTNTGEIYLLYEQAIQKDVHDTFIVYALDYFI